MHLIVKGGVSVYYKSSIAFTCLQECLIFEILIRGKSFLYLFNFIALYRSPSQSRNSFEKYANNLQLSLDKIINQNPFLIVALGDFNTKSSNWSKRDKTT